MRKGRELIGRPVISYDTGERFASIQDLIFDPQAHVLLGFITHNGILGKGVRVLPLSNIQSLGPDVAIVSSKSAVVPLERAADLQRALRHTSSIRRMKIVSADGSELGMLRDLYVDLESGLIEGYDVRRRSAAAGQRSMFLSAAHTLRLGKHVAFAMPSVAHAAEQQRAAPRPALKAREAGGSDTVPIPLQEGDRAEEPPGLLASGKIAHWDITASDGTVIIRKGEQATESVVHHAAGYGLLDELYRAIGGVSIEDMGRPDSPSPEHARGLPVQWTVRASRGLIVAAPGQIVTQQVIDRARLYGKQRDLLEAVGLLPRAEAQHGEQRDELDRAAEEAQPGVPGWWLRLRRWMRNMQRRSARQAEEQRIKRALGRPSTRAILDRDDRVIINAGELITNQTVEQARQAGVLDVLLSSVYTRDPEFSKEDLRFDVANSADDGLEQHRR